MQMWRKTVTILASCVVMAATFAPTGAMAHVENDSWAQKEHLEERAMSQRGAPYSYGGGSPSGFDCSGFTRWVFADHGPSLPHSSDEQFAMGNRNGYKRIWDRADLEVGDLVFHDTSSGRVGHVGLYVGGGKFISSTSSSGVQVRSLYDSYWGPRWVGATRTPVTMGR